MDKKYNLIHIYSGDGKGKTTASVGLAVRAAGSGMKILFAQFFKSGNSSEIKILNATDNIDCVSPEKVFGRFKNMNDTERAESKLIYSELLNAVISKSADYDLVVLDESVSAYNYGMIDKRVLTDWLKTRSCEIVLTGRKPADELIELADYVSEIKKIKHPYDKGVNARRGIEF